MAAVHIGIRHNDDLMVAELFNVELVPDPGTQRNDQGIELIVAVNFIGARLFDVEHLAPHREDRLKS